MTELLHQLEAPGDAELISRVREGDLEAYGDLYARHVDAARRLARQLVRGPDSDDLVSDAFAKVMAVLQRGGGPDVAFRAYLLTAVRRLHVDRIRATSRLTTTDDLEAFDPGVPFQDTAVAQFENGAAARAFASLPERWQLVLWHLEVEGQKPAEIAVLLGMSPNSVSALAYRAREGLRQAFLAAHLTTADQAECRWVTERLGGYVRKGLSKRDHDKVALHLDVCPRCTAMYLELNEVNDNLAGIIAPLLLGGLAAGYLGSGGAGAAGGVVALLGRAKDAVTGNAGPVVAGTAAATVAVATLIAIAVTGDDEPPLAAGGDRSSTDTADGSDRGDPAGPGGSTPGSRLPSPRTADEPALRVASPMLLEPAEAAEPVVLVEAAAPTSVAELVAEALAPGTDAGTGTGAGPTADPDTDPGTDPGPTPGPTLASRRPTSASPGPPSPTTPSSSTSTTSLRNRSPSWSTSPRTPVAPPSCPASGCAASSPPPRPVRSA